MKKILFISAILLASCTCKKPTKKQLTKEINSLAIIIKKQQEYIQDLEYQISVFEDELNSKEDEISYLGHKLDSIKQLKK